MFLFGWVFHLLCDITYIEVYGVLRRVFGPITELVGYGMDNRGTVVSFPTGAQLLPFLHRAQKNSEAH
jgi:hypothetical protein